MQFLRQAWSFASSRLRWRLGLNVAAGQLEAGSDASVSEFYNQRITDCAFLQDPNEYEYPRAAWILAQVRGGHLLEIGCGNGGMTRLLSRQVDRITALDISLPSLEAVDKLSLPNVDTQQALVERYTPDVFFDWIVMSEVLEHLRYPAQVVHKTNSWLKPGGSLLITTPNGFWESNEHLQEFSFESFGALFSDTDAESVEISYLRDREGRRRWLVARLSRAERPEKNDFPDRRKIRESRRSRTAATANTGHGRH